MNEEMRVSGPLVQVPEIGTDALDDGFAIAPGGKRDRGEPPGERKDEVVIVRVRRPDAHASKAASSRAVSVLAGLPIAAACARVRGSRRAK